MQFEESQSWHRRAGQVLTCGGAQTLSKAADRFPVQHPLYAASARGCRIRDVDGNEFIDYVCALGPIILGYSHPVVNDAIRRQLQNGTVYSLEHPLTVEVAGMICAMVPCAERVRFVKTGSDACEAALRVARTYTGRPYVVSIGYHGWGNEFQSAASDARGRAGTVESQVLEVEFNRLDTVQEIAAHHGAKLAAILVEPMRHIPPAPGYLGGLASIADRTGAVLIFDEIVTGFRWALGGAQEYFGVTPDLCTLGKAMANGMPLGAVAGRADIMSAFDRCFVSGTYAGETLSLAAAQATLNFLQASRVIPHIWQQGETLRDAFNAAAEAHGIEARLLGYGPLTVQTFDGPRAQETKFLWLQETIRRGVLFGNIQYTQWSHEYADMNETVRVIDDAMPAVAAALGRSGGA